jgi:hypothetical protein
VLLVAGAIVLLVSILIGQKLGDRVLLQTERRSPLAGGAITPVPQTEPSAANSLRNWKRLQVVSVATDPAFPDPRVTRPPTPTPAPAAPAAPPRPRVTPIPEPVGTLTPPPANSTYTSPPLPMPIATHAPGETETEPPTLSPQERSNVAPSVNATPPHF